MKFENLNTKKKTVQLSTIGTDLDINEIIEDFTVRIKRLRQLLEAEKWRKGQ